MAGLPKEAEKMEFKNEKDIPCNPKAATRSIFSRSFQLKYQRNQQGLEATGGDILGKRKNPLSSWQKYLGGGVVNAGIYDVGGWPPHPTASVVPPAPEQAETQRPSKSALRFSRNAMTPS